MSAFADVDHFVKSANRITRMHDPTSLLIDAVATLGFDQVALMHHVTTPEGRAGPSAWSTTRKSSAGGCAPARTRRRWGQGDEAFVRHPLALRIAEIVLGPWCDRLQLNLTRALQIHPGQREQPSRRDENMGRLTPYRSQNGTQS